MGSSPQYRHLFYHFPPEKQSSFVASRWPLPQDTISRSYYQNLDYGFPKLASTDNHVPLEAGVQVEINPNFGGVDWDVQTCRSHSVQERSHIDYSVSAPWGLSGHYQQSSTFGLQPDPGLGHLTSPSPLVPQEDPVAVTPAPSSEWSERPFESWDEGVRAQSANLFEQSWMDFHGFSESSVEGRTMNTDHRYPAEPVSPFSYDDYRVLNPPISPLSLSPTDDHIQPYVLETSPTKPAQQKGRSVSSPAIVQASRLRRKIDPESGTAQPSRFHCPDKRCTELGVGFTAKHRLDDHLLRHAGKKPFHCTVCCDVNASFTNKSELHKHQKTKKCSKNAGLLTVSSHQ
ncbi:hypothetical protein GYMLUDRAFT_832837 [Collybiopsis luxurians FD-317 M1]|uniref:C2H2-type domain-containing protein n=1 Tax=Collybiopsis luxurians FD-317 M1 TaxID=944289 RepID=A0A0D0C0I4_9AGAR|nr:hypothetical protein GYMLUDRAFT_832837 [Collybiopsis luxurians FD-317 M1]